MTLLAGPAAADAASERAGQWLARMAEAVDSLNYEGTFVYNHDDKLETMRIVHRVDPRGSRERL
ncbi:MAG: transcriptional regulator, partial [Gammaproteobacteria bacterium]|nr:transcriptional regulator [Gammaproteobacteria bacterium]